MFVMIRGNQIHCFPQSRGIFRQRLRVNSCQFFTFGIRKDEYHPWSTVTCDQSFPLLTIWPLAVSYVETRSYPSRISQCWSNILRSRGNGAISQEIRYDSTSNKVSFSMIHSLINTHLPLRGFCFVSIIKPYLMMVIRSLPSPTAGSRHQQTPVPWLVEKRV